MLLDQFSDRPTRKAPEGVRTAGLLSLVDAARTIGGKWQGMAKFAEDEAKSRNPVNMWNEFRAFKDPTSGDPGHFLDLGPSYTGRPLNRFASQGHVIKQGQDLRDYLDGLEIADEFGPQLSQYRIGIAPAPGFDAGVMPPQPKWNQPGMLVVGSHVPEAEYGRLIEHEMQHVLDGITGAPIGTNPDIAPEQLQHLFDTGALARDPWPGYRQQNMVDRVPTSEATYNHSYGETMARVAEDRYAYPELANKAPSFTDFVQAGRASNTRINPGLLWKFRETDEEALKAAKAAKRNAPLYPQYNGKP